MLEDMLEIPRNLIDDGDEVVITELEAALLAAEENCSGDICTLPPTQQLQIRVIHIFLISYSG